MDCFDDQTIARMIEPGTEPPPGFDAHLDECAACRELVMAAARRTTSSRPTAKRPEPGHTVGRYVLRQRIGEGGSGVVYSAWDPELEREVAVKLVAASLDPSHNARLLDEARTMARLTHPNVVRVYDAGTVGDSVFLAMELMHGGTLRDWQRERRSWRVVLERYLEAGRGLAAAHELGLVHRDFKPSNVMLTAEGRACVGDFGLASFDVSTVREVEKGEKPKIAGTPIYMSPEAHRGGPLDARSDQYSFCFALFEALSGHLPYAGASVRAVETSKRAGTIEPGPRPGPRAIYHALTQGLRPDPAARFASMAELLRALEAVERRRRSIAAVAVVASASLAGALAYGFVVEEREPDCSDAGDAIAEVWNEDEARELEAQAATVDLAAASDIVRRTTERFDAYAYAWTESSIATCRAAHSGALTDDAHTRRLACLDEGLVAIESLAHELESLDAEAVAFVGDAAASLPDLEDCNDPDGSIPTSVESLAALRELRGARATDDLNRFQSARVEIERILAEAVANEDVWVAAEAGMLACRNAIRHDDPVAAIRLCEQAAAYAVQSGHARAAAIAWALVFAWEAQRLRHPEVAARFELLADAAAKLAADPSVFAVLADSRAAALEVTDRPAAVEQAKLAVQFEIEASGVEHPLVAGRRLTLVRLLGELDRREEALALLRETREALQETSGTDDRRLAKAWLLEGALHLAATDLPQAIAAYEQAAVAYGRILGPGALETLDTRTHLAIVRGYHDPNALAESLAELDEVLPRLRALRSPGVWEQEATRALLLQSAGRSDEAISACLAAVDGARELSGADSGLMIIPHLRCGDIHSKRKEREPAMKQWEEAFRVCKKVNGPESQMCTTIARLIDDTRVKWNMPPREPR